MTDNVKGVEIDPVREKLYALIDDFDVMVAPTLGFRHYLIDYLIANGVRLELKQATNASDNKASDENKLWIPVAERLPGVPDGWEENPEPVLYMMKNNQKIYAGYYGENGTYRDKYFRTYNDRYEGVDVDDVIGWMWQHSLLDPLEGD